MDAPQADPTWIDLLKYSLIAMIASLAMGRPWADPKTGALSVPQTIQAVFTWLLFGVGTAAAQERFHQPFWITGLFAAGLSFVGLPVITTVVQTGFQLFVKAKFGASNGPTDKP